MTRADGLVALERDSNPKTSKGGKAPSVKVKWSTPTIVTTLIKQELANRGSRLKVGKSEVRCSYFVTHLHIMHESID